MKTSFIFPTLFLAIFSVNVSVRSCWHNQTINTALMQTNIFLMQENLRTQQQMSQLRQEMLEMQRMSALQQQATQDIIWTMTIFLQGNRQLNDSLYFLQENFNQSELLFNDERYRFEQELAELKARVAALQSTTTSNTNKNESN